MFVSVSLNSFDFDIVQGHDKARDIVYIVANIFMIILYAIFFAYVSDKIEFIEMDQEKHLNEFKQYKDMFDCL